MSDSPATPGSPPAAAPPKPDATPAPKDGAGAAPVAPAGPRKVRLALDGDDEREYDLDAVRANYKKGVNSAQLMSKADQRLKEATEREKRAAAQGERLKNRDEAEKLLAELGIDAEEFAESLLVPRIQQKMMSKEQLDAHTHRQRADAAEGKLKALDDKRKADEEEAAVNRWQNQEGERALNALQKMGMPQEAAGLAVWRVAKYLDREVERMQADESYQPHAPEDIAAAVIEEYRGEHKSLTNSLSGEALIQWLGPDVLKKIRSHDLAVLRQKQGRGFTQSPAPGVTPGQPTNGAPKKRYLSEAEWDAEMTKRIQEG